MNEINGDPNGDQWGYELFSLQSVPLTTLNEKYARKVVDTLNDLDNVLFEIVNEANHDSRDFQYHMVRYIQNYEAANKPKQHPVGMTSYRDPGNEPRGADSDLFASPADYISPGLTFYRDDPPAADARKVIILDTDHIGNGNINWVWKTFTRGMNPIYMDTWDLSEATLEGTRKALGHVVAYAKRMNLSAMTPRNDLASSTYCLANAGQEYLIYLPEGGTVTVNLSAAEGLLDVDWVHPVDGTNRPAEAVMGGERRLLKAPFDGAAVLYIRKGQDQERTR